MKNILCYGDSNTWGFVPGSFDPKTSYVKRYSRETRWTRVLQEQLGNDYYIIEEGMNGRTTNVDYAAEEGKNGKTFLPVALCSHAPLDLVILFLGGNDLKNEFNRSAKDIADGLGELVQVINESPTFGPEIQSSPQVLLTGYPIPRHEHGFIEQFGFTDAIKRAQQLDGYVSEIAKQHQCHYFNAAPHIALSDIDGLHLDESGHKLFAELMLLKVKNIFGSV